MKEVLEVLDKMSEEILDVVAKYNTKVPLASAVGVLEIVKLEIIDNHKE